MFHLFVISTGGGFCFHSGEIFLKAMGLLGFIFFINCFIFLMATFMNIWLLGRSLGCARDDNWRIALFLELFSYLWNVGFLFVRLFSYFYNDSPIVISTIAIHFLPLLIIFSKSLIVLYDIKCTITMFKCLCLQKFIIVACLDIYWV